MSTSRHDGSSPGVQRERAAVPPARTSLLVCAVALAAAAPAVLEAALGRVRAATDLGWFFLPLWSWWWEDPRPLGGWNPWLFAGFPAAADPQLAVWHPFTALYGLLPPLAAASLEGALAPAIAAVGMLLYLRRAGAGDAGSALGALSFALGGFVAAHAPHPSIVRVAMVLPWGLLAIEALERTRLAGALGLAAGLVVLAGQPQVSALALLLLGLYALVLGRPFRARRWPWLGAGFALGACIGAALWLPMLELIAASTRAVRAPEFPNPTLALRDLPLLLAPFAGGGGLGPLGGGERSGLACGLIECSAYPGVVAWLAVLAGVGPLLRDPRGRFWLVVALAGVAIATGTVPLPTGVRGPARMLLWWNLGLAAAAGIGLGAVLRRPFRAGPWLAALVLVVVALVAVAVLGPPGRRAGVLGVAAALAVAVVALGVARRGGRAAYALPVALALDLWLFGATLVAGGVTPAAFAAMRAPVAALREVVEPPCGADPHERVLVLDLPFSIDWAAVLQVRSVQGYDPLVLKSLAELLGQLEHGLESVGFVSDAALAAPANRVLDALRVGLVVRDPGQRNPLGTAVAVLARAGDPRWEAAEACARAGVEAYRNRRARPVAWLVERTLAAEPDAARARLRGADGGFDVEHAVLLVPSESGAAGAPASDAAADPDASSGAGSVRVERYGADAIDLAVDAAADAWLVTSELAYPGWRAFVDGVPTDVVLANGAFRALRVPAGAHRVRLEFRPRAALAGAAALALGVVAALALLVAPSRRAGGA